MLSRVYGSVDLSKACNSEVPSLTPCSSCFSLLFINNLINDKSKHKKNCLLFIFYFPPTVIYNMYKSMNS